MEGSCAQQWVEGVQLEPETGTRGGAREGLERTASGLNMEEASYHKDWKALLISATGNKA